MAKIGRTGLPVERKILGQPRAKHIRTISKRHSLLAYPRQFKSFIGKNKGALLEAFGLIEKNLDKLGTGAAIEGDSGIRIEKAGTGSQGGNFNLLTMKVTFKNKQFFVKKSSWAPAEENLRGAIMIDEYLKKRGYKAAGFNVRVLFPHVVYARRSKGYVVSDFFNESEVVQVCDYKWKRAKQLRWVLKNLKPDGTSFDIIPVNAFYQPSTRTILLFDLVG